jgi:hypothetical protein
VAFVIAENAIRIRNRVRKHFSNRRLLKTRVFLPTIALLL